MVQYFYKISMSANSCLYNLGSVFAPRWCFQVGIAVPVVPCTSTIMFDQQSIFN